MAECEGSGEGLVVKHLEIDSHGFEYGFITVKSHCDHSGLPVLIHKRYIRGPHCAAGVVIPNDCGARENHVRHTDQCDHTVCIKGEYTIRKTDQADCRIGEQYAACGGIVFIVSGIQPQGPLPHEDRDIVSAENRVAALLDKGHVSLNGDKVSDIQAQPRAKQLDVRISVNRGFVRRREGNVDGTAVDDQDFIDGNRGGVDAESDASAHIKSSGRSSHINLPGNHAGNATVIRRLAG